MTRPATWFIAMYKRFDEWTYPRMSNEVNSIPCPPMESKEAVQSWLDDHDTDVRDGTVFIAEFKGTKLVGKHVAYIDGHFMPYPSDGLELPDQCPECNHSEFEITMIESNTVSTAVCDGDYGEFKTHSTETEAILEIECLHCGWTIEVSEEGE